MFVHICINVLFLFFVKTNLSKISAIWARSPDPQSSATGIYTLALVLPTVLPRPASSQVYFSSATQSYLTLCDPRDCSIPGFCVHHQLLELAPTYVHWVGDAIQPCYPLSSYSPPAFNLSQHQGLFRLVSSSHQVAKVLEFQLQQQSFQWIFRIDFL